MNPLFLGGWEDSHDYQFGNDTTHELVGARQDTICGGRALEWSERVVK